MTVYLEFQTNDGETILVEVNPTLQDTLIQIPTPNKGGEVEAAIPFAKEVTDKLEETASKVVIKAQDTFENSFQVIKHHAHAIWQTIKNIDVVDRPDEMEMTFGLTAKGDLGTMAVAKVGVEATYTVKLS